MLQVIHPGTDLLTLTDVADTGVGLLPVAMQQGCCCTNIRLSEQQLSFFSRWTYEEFFSRYRLLLRGPQNPDRAQALCRQALPELIPDPDQYCFGKTKVFFRAGQVAFLERLRAERLRGAAVIIQSRARGWLARIRYTRLQQAAVTIQKHCRGALARR